jgi:hypothetical protein
MTIMAGKQRAKRSCLCLLSPLLATNQPSTATMSSDPTSANDETSNLTARPDTAPPQDQLEAITPGVTDAATPPSELPSESVSNVASSNIQIGPNETIDELPFLPAASPTAFVPDEIGSSLEDDSKSAAARPSPPNLRPSPSDNFLSAVLAVTTPTNGSSSFLSNFGSAASNRSRQLDYFSGFDFESLNGMFSTPSGGDGAATGQIAFPVQQRSVPRPQPPVDSL